MFNTAVIKPQRMVRPLPDNTVPRQGKTIVPLPVIAADAVQNPHPADAASIARGKVLFDTVCIACHGALGKGDGLVATKGVPPIDLTDAYRSSFKDGYIWATILRGSMSTLMPKHSEAIGSDEAWDIVNYLRTLQHKS